MATDETSMIDDYLLDRLPPEDRRAFETRLAQDSGLAGRVAERRQLLTQIEIYGDHLIKQRLRTIHQREASTPPSPTRRRWWPLLLLALALLALLLWWALRRPSPQQLYADYYQTYPLSLSQRATEQPDPLAQIDRHYQNGEFDRALPLLEQSLREAPDQSQLRLALAITYLELDRPAAAETALRELLANDFDPFREQAQWYLALLYLKRGELTRVRPYLESLAAEEGGDFYKRARRLLGELPLPNLHPGPPLPGK
ncbi:MAG: tetratricopeptide repeat protein [Bacteroidota bacterium]